MACSFFALGIWCDLCSESGAQLGSLMHLGADKLSFELRLRDRHLSFIGQYTHVRSTVQCPVSTAIDRFMLMGFPSNQENEEIQTKTAQNAAFVESIRHAHMAATEELSCACGSN